MRVGYMVGYDPVEMRTVQNIEASQQPHDGGHYLRITFRPEPGVDNGKTVDAVGMFWVDNIPVFHLPENW